MKIGELIERLRHFNPDWDVYVLDFDTGAKVAAERVSLVGDDYLRHVTVEDADGVMLW